MIGYHVRDWTNPENPVQRGGKRREFPAYTVYPLHQNVPELTFSCLKVQQRTSYPLISVWVLFLFYPAWELSYMASSYPCNFRMHFQMELNRSHNSFRITFQYWKWISGLPLAIAASLHGGNNLPEPMRKQHTERAAVAPGEHFRWECIRFWGQWTLWEDGWNQVLFKQSKNFPKKSWVAVLRCAPWCGGSKYKGLVMEG